MVTDWHGRVMEPDDRPSSIPKPRCQRCGAFVSMRNEERVERYEGYPGEEYLTHAWVIKCGKCQHLNVMWEQQAQS